MSCQCNEKAHAGRTDLQYAVKIACGVVPAPAGNILPPGQYFTAINVHNPSRCDTVTFRWKVAVGLQGLRVGPVSQFAQASLGPDEALEIDCPDVMERLKASGTTPPTFVKGWVVIETEEPLDVVAVYGTAQSAGNPLNAFHTERVQPRCLPACEDFGFDISTGIAAWNVTVPGATTPELATLTSLVKGWATLAGASWIRPGNTNDPGDYVYRLGFHLCSGFKNASLNLQLLADNGAEVFLNTIAPANKIGATSPASSTNTAPFTTPTVLSNISGPFKAGYNELIIVVRNLPLGDGGSPTGLAVQGYFDVEKGRCPGTGLPLLPCPGVCYQVHVKGDGWLDWRCNGATAGTTGENRRMEAIKITLTGATPGATIEYQAHLENIGWTSWTAEGQVCGTTGQNRRMEAVKIRLINAPLRCHVRYRVHMKNKGWGDWAYDGAQAGTTGENRRIEAIEIVVE